MTESGLVGEVAAKPEAGGAVIAPTSAAVSLAGQAHGPTAEIVGEIGEVE